MSVSRRGFVQGSLATAGCASLCSSGCGNTVHAPPYIDVVVDDDSRSSTYGKIVLTPAELPQLLRLGGALTLRVGKLEDDPQRTFTVPDKGILLIHRDPADGSDEYVALRGDCPHQGCALGYDFASDLVECPCHCSRFLASGPSNQARCAGLVVHPPAKDNLTVWQVVPDGLGRLFIDLSTVQTCGVTPIPPAVDGVISFPVAMLPALTKVGGSVIGQPNGLSDTLIVARIDETTIVTLSDICPHRGCGVKLDLPDAGFHCFCHDSYFSYEGTVVKGPSPAPLTRYATTFDGATVTITVA